MISFSAPLYDPFGTLILYKEPYELYSAKRRSTVTATLDGGVSVYDTGYSVADRTIKVNVDPATLDQIGAIAYMIESYSQLIVSTRAGCFLALCEYNQTRTELSIVIRIIEEIS